VTATTISEFAAKGTVLSLIKRDSGLDRVGYVEFRSGPFLSSGRRNLPNFFPGLPARIVDLCAYWVEIFEGGPGDTRNAKETLPSPDL